MYERLGFDCLAELMFDDYNKAKGENVKLMFDDYNKAKGENVIIDTGEHKSFKMNGNIIK